MKFDFSYFPFNLLKKNYELFLLKKTTKFRFASLISNIVIIVILFVSLIRLNKLSDNTRPMTGINKDLAVLQNSSVISKTLVQVAPNWWEENRKIYFGIPTRILFYLPFEKNNITNATNIAKLAWNEFDRIGRIFNNYDKNSVLSSLINSEYKTSAIEAPNEIVELISVSKAIYQLSTGAFDPTVWPIKKLWQLAQKRQKKPSLNELSEAVAKTGIFKVHVDATSNKLRFEQPNIEFDFGGIVKGYSVDHVRELIKKQGALAGIVQNGGEIAAFGTNDGSLDGNKNWRIGIQHPKESNKIWGVINNQHSIRVSTSGNYQQALLIEGKEYYHIFNPKNGEPVSTKILGVTIISFDESTSNTIIDGVSKIIPVLGPRKGMELIQQIKLECVVLLNNENKIIELKTPGLTDKNYQNLMQYPTQR